MKFILILKKDTIIEKVVKCSDKQKEKEKWAELQQLMLQQYTNRHRRKDSEKGVEKLEDVMAKNCQNMLID